MTSPGRARYFVVNIVFSGRFLHRDALHFFECLRIIDNQRPIHFPDTHQRVFAITGELGMRRHFPRAGFQLRDDFKFLLIHKLDHVAVGSAIEYIHPGIRRIFMAAHKKSRPQCFDIFDNFPTIRIDHRDHALFQVGRCHDRFALIVERDTRAEMRQARQTDAGDPAPRIEIDNLPDPLAR